jgi:5-methyltetrahydrofolate--homocysteine methyltransferase
MVDAFAADHDTYKEIMLKALADRLAEAFAEYLHEVVRKEIWGYAPNEDISKDALFRIKYQGIRPAPGYPTQPDHTETGKIWELLNTEEVTEIKLTESYAMWPAASVCGHYFANPNAKYF